MRNLIKIVENGVGRGSRDGDAYFNITGPQMEDAENWRSRATLVYMSPDDFLLMAKRGYDAYKANTVLDLVKRGVKFSSLPMLSFTHDGKGVATVVGHEGRHRAGMMKAEKVREMPVILISSENGDGKCIRWGQQDHEGFDKVDVMPRVLRGEDGRGEIPMPVSAIFPSAGE